ncbi:hypothetical protein [Rhizomicrobium electricum]|uniref:hypothetical protein n=1 Tax=Rhizomicrobium electricum TaxID=480070 RepID=UPI00141E9232|nr:hypothetical protein [Rhizomicrobium electricum]NIJ49472.1 hypothetical protein [Rhizomicrobium electricum]
MRFVLGVFVTSVVAAISLDANAAGESALSQRQLRQVFESVGARDLRQIALQSDYYSPGNMVYAASEQPRQTTREICTTREIRIAIKAGAPERAAPEWVQITSQWFNGSCKSVKFFHSAQGLTVDEIPRMIELAVGVAHGAGTNGIVHFESEAIRIAAAQASMANVWDIGRSPKDRVRCSFFVPRLKPEMLSVELVFDGNNLKAASVYEENGPDIVAVPAR